MVKLVPAFRGALPDADGPADGPAVEGPVIGAGVDAAAAARLAGWFT